LRLREYKKKSDKRDNRKEGWGTPLGPLRRPEPTEKTEQEIHREVWVQETEPREFQLPKKKIVWESTSENKGGWGK